MTDETRPAVEPQSARRWRDDLESWAIPPEILAAAPESPWGCPTTLFARSTEETLAAGGGLTAGGQPSPSFVRAREVLPEGGSVLDVGAGAGAASLPLCPPGAEVTAVDQSADMLAAFAALAGKAGVSHREVEGRWPDAAGHVGSVDVVVCHHVLYNVADLVPFLEALTDHARIRVVVEITAEHPQAGLNELWQHFHGAARPTRPTAADAAAVARDLGYEVGVEAWDAPPRWNGGEHRDHLVAFTRRRLCLPAERDAEVAALLPDHGPRAHATLWWPGRAS
jgi:SAM-dependent methyltransferase